MSEKKQNGKRGSVNFDIPLSEEQARAKEQILHHPFNFIIGEAGTGKTLLAVQIALDLVFKKEKSKIIITRPTVSTEDNGFIPGAYEEKIAPWLVPIDDNMRKVYTHSEKLDELKKAKIIEALPLAYFRGRTFDNAVCIIDEFQNINFSQLKMAIGRLGKDSIMIFCGDRHQIDLKIKTDSAVYGIDRIKNHPAVFVVELQQNHRHEAINDLLRLLSI